MTRRCFHRCGPRLGVAALCLAPGFLAAAQPVSLRAGGALNGDIVRYIADNAQAQPLDPANLAIDRRRTPREVIQQRCGEVRDEYVEALLRANRDAGLSLDEPLGETAGEIVWPACLYVKTADDGSAAGARGFPVVMHKGDSAARAYTRLTGANGRPADVERFFRRDSRNSRAPLANVQVGEILLGAQLTAPVTVLPKEDNETFANGLRALVANDATAKVRTVELPTGEIVMPVEAGTTASASDHCVRSDAAFDAARTERALAFAVERAALPEFNVAQGRADVVVVDNGFFGADVDANPGDPFNASPFDSKFFRPATNGAIAQYIGIIDTWPINTRTGVVSIEMGHGTHVAGLALGGPGFAHFRDAIASGATAWTQLSVLNIARGKRELIRNAEEALNGLLGTPGQFRIVNMSIAYDGSTDISATFKKMFENGRDTLFVVAAGNHGSGQPGNVLDLSIVPATLGGTLSDNVVTVAATGGDGLLTPTSNFGNPVVDLAAPGCEIESWISNDAQVTRMSGTSQAAPIVTFAASLLRYVSPHTPASALKARLVVSGDLLPVADQDKLTYRVAVDIPKALYWFDDVVTLAGEHAGTYVGKVEDVRGLACKVAALGGSVNADRLWALKRDAQATWIYGGRDLDSLRTPCEATVAGDALLRFTPAFRIDGAESAPVAPEPAWSIGMADVAEIVMRSKFN